MKTQPGLSLGPVLVAMVLLAGAVSAQMRLEEVSAVTDRMLMLQVCEGNVVFPRKGHGGGAKVIVKDQWPPHEWWCEDPFSPSANEFTPQNTLIDATVGYGYVWATEGQ